MRVKALSSAESEFMQAFEAAKEAVWLTRIITSLGYCPNGPVPIMEDNEAAIYMSEKPTLSGGRARHMELRWEWLNEICGLKRIKLVPIKTHEQLADLCTKAVDRKTFDTLSPRMMGESPMLTHAILQALVDCGLAIEQNNEVADYLEELSPDLGAQDAPPPVLPAMPPQRNDPAHMRARIMDNISRRLDELMPLPQPVQADNGGVPSPPPAYPGDDEPRDHPLAHLPLLEAVPMIRELNANLNQATARARDHGGDIDPTVVDRSRLLSRHLQDIARAEVDEAKDSGERRRLRIAQRILCRVEEAHDQLMLLQTFVYGPAGNPERDTAAEAREILRYLRNTDNVAAIRPVGGWNRIATTMLLDAANTETHLAIIVGHLGENTCFHHPLCHECRVNGIYLQRVEATTRAVARRAGHRICMPGSCCRCFWNLNEQEMQAEVANVRSSPRRRRNNGHPVRRSPRYINNAR